MPAAASAGRFRKQNLSWVTRGGGSLGAAQLPHDRWAIGGSRSRPARAERGQGRGSQGVISECAVHDRNGSGQKTLDLTTITGLAVGNEEGAIAASIVHRREPRQRRPRLRSHGSTVIRGGSGDGHQVGLVAHHVRQDRLEPATGTKSTTSRGERSFERGPLRRWIKAHCQSTRRRDDGRFSLPDKPPVQDVDDDSAGWRKDSDAWLPGRPSRL